MPRLLFGPCDDPVFHGRFLQAPIARGDWAVFGARCPSWAESHAGEPPEVLVVWPGYTSVPAWVWNAPVPLVAAAHDPNLLWHSFGHSLPHADLVLTDAPSARKLRDAGLEHVRAANLFGLDRHFAAAVNEPEGPRDLDLVFVGNVNPHIQAQRMPWLGRVAALAGRYRVLVTAGVFGAEYRALLRWAKLVFNRSIRGECNLRAFEAAASGAVLLQEAGNTEVPEYLQPEVEYAPYTDTDFEAVVERLLNDDRQRRAMADAARERVRRWTFDALVEAAVGVGGTGWDDVLDRARLRRDRAVSVNRSGRVWQRASAIGPDADPNLVADLVTAGDQAALGALARSPADAQPHLGAAACTNRVAAIGHAVALAELGRIDDALAAVREALAALEERPELTAEEADTVPYPARLYWVRTGWERAGYDHPGNPGAERAAKFRLLRGRALSLAAELSGTITDHQAAVEALPDQPHLRAALGAALLRVGRAAEAIEPLRAALVANPFDNASAGTLMAALTAAGRTDEGHALHTHRRVLATAAPTLIAALRPPTEPAPTAPASQRPKPAPVLDTVPAANPTPIAPAPPAPTPATPTPNQGAKNSASEGAAFCGAGGTPTPQQRQRRDARTTTTQPVDHLPTPIPPHRPKIRFVDLSPADFTARFGAPDTTTALAAFTPTLDTRAILTLVIHARPRRVLEVGTAAGHMTANLTAFTPEDAVVYSIGLVAGANTRSGTPHQDHELPPRDQFAKFLNHFGTGHKALLVTADSRAYDFSRLAPLDLVFVDGGHDFATARSDSLAAYRTLRPGGYLIWHDLPSSTPWVEVERAVTDLAFPEPVYRVAGTQVAFLVKGEGLGAATRSESGRVAVTWDGAFDAVHSLAHVNRAIGSALVARGHAVGLVPQPPSRVPAPPHPVPPELAALVGSAPTKSVHVRHRWPPDFTPPEGTGAFVLIQPWEFGRLPRTWIEPLVGQVDEVWVPSRSVLRAFVASGVPETRVVVIPNGVDPDHFRPGLDPLPLATDKRVKLLFVGGTIPRKGIDVLLAAYRRAFTRADDVCLVVKDMGVGTFYRNQTAGDQLARFRADPRAPELLYLTDDLSETEVPRLYAACDALVHPYRGEGFGLPVLEAMACGLPVAVTAGGPTDEFVPLNAGWLVPARLRYFDQEAVGGEATVGRPWWLEPNLDALVTILHALVADGDERRTRGRAARQAALGFTWARTAAAIEDRIRVLGTRTPVRFARGGTTRLVAPPVPAPPAPARADTLTDPVVLSRAATLPRDGPFVGGPAPGSAPALATRRLVVPAVAGKIRVSLTMIVKNEERHLPKCLTSARDLVDEAILYDTGSTDRTREIARSFGCIVDEFPWIDNFAAARNAALERATGDYAFWMDADDYLDDDNRPKLKALFASLPRGNAAFVLRCLCATAADPTGANGTAVHHVRLFRTHPAHRWTYRVHEQILPSLRATGADVRWSDVCVRHVGYVDPAVRGRKLDRDLRLLRLQEAEMTDEPFTLFNLGMVYLELGRYPEAIGALERSLSGSHPRDSIVRKTFALLVRCRTQSGDRVRAEDACRRGRGYYPDDAELLFLAAGLAHDAGDLRTAEALYRRLIDGSEGDHFASVDTGLRTVKGRHKLAVMLVEQHRFGEAEGLWRAALAHDPLFRPAQIGLGELYIKTGNATGLGCQLAALEELGEEGAVQAALLFARWNTERGDHAGAAALLEAAVQKMPWAPGLRVALSHALIHADAPPEDLERAFRGVLELDPRNKQARRNLDVLYRKTGRWIEGVIDETQPPPSA